MSELDRLRARVDHLDRRRPEDLQQRLATVAGAVDRSAEPRR
jgi:hypothetical protein